MNYYDRIAYDPIAGSFTWAKAGKGIVVGKQAGYVDAEGYRSIRIGYKHVRAARLAWFLVYGVWPDGEIDHINRDRLDNRLVNLRVVSRAENAQNISAHRDSSTGLQGIAWNKQHKRWQAKLMANKVRHHLGYFSTPEAAHAAYLDAKSRLHIGGGGH